MDDNKRNIMYFESGSMRSLYESIDTWQDEHRKRLLSINVQRDGDRFCCIALTNPSEVVIVDADGGAALVADGALCVLSIPT